ncbi:MAG TPA: hypothetical protein VMW69_01220, partial [Spirochaetia bacterium]|nr:hypothetical protein [Spirochaetia bacterium]
MEQHQVKAIEDFVTAQRRALRTDVEDQLHAYGIQGSGDLLPEASLSHLPDDERRTADQLRQRLAHLSAASKPK